jgi:formylglycine-generating enzyme required for sulfatase activity
LAPLGQVFRDKDRTTERIMAANILAHHAADQPQLLADLLMDADEKQFAVLYPTLHALDGRGLALLTGEVDRRLPPEATEEDREKLAKRQANAAVALLKMNQPAKVWPLLKHSPDPSVRSYLIHRFGPLGVDARALVKRLDEEPDVTIRRALLLSLGEFGEKELVRGDRAVLLPKLQATYQNHADPGLHGAAEWLLRQWKQEQWLNETNEAWAKDEEWREKRLERIRKQLASGGHQPLGSQPHWYVNGQGQTMVVIPRPAHFMMGSPPTEANREGGPEGTWETLHEKGIDRSFAIAAKEVTIQQFLRFRKDQSYHKQYAPTPDRPIHNVSWYDAAAYCNWLSQQEEIPSDQWCYEPSAKNGFAEGMKLASDYLKRTGYRLPTEAEWEFSCRAGALTSRYFGQAEELMDKYAWYAKNSLVRWMLPVGSLKPNDLGLFDMQGNAAEWCQDAFYAYKPGEGGQTSPDIEDKNVEINNERSRVTRGAAFDFQPAFVRSADRSYRFSPMNQDISLGFRPARTFR